MVINKNKKKFRIRRSLKLRYNFNKSGAIRLVVHRTSRHIYAQVITANPSSVISAASTLDKDVLKYVKYTGNIKAATVVGKLVAKRTLKKGISKVSFDRSGFKYHGRVKALAEASRKTGLIF